MLKDFRQFVLRGNVVDLAVGIVIGAAFTGIVNSIVKGLIDPLVGFAGTGSLAEKSLCIGGEVVNGKARCAAEFLWGDVVSSILQFLIVAAVVFFFVVKPVNSLMTRFKPEAPQEQTTRECPECLSTVPKRARRCMFCIADIGAAT